MSKLLAEGRTDLLAGFVSSRTRRKFKAYLVRGKDGKIGFEFEPRPARGAAGKAAAPAEEEAGAQAAGSTAGSGKPVAARAGGARKAAAPAKTGAVTATAKAKAKATKAAKAAPRARGAAKK
jgi:DNA topoisomerase-3